MAIADKFYTKKEKAKKCVEKLFSLFDLKEELFLEPTAGNGAFLDYLPKFEAYDLIPEDDRIIQKNIFDFDSEYKEYITIGNPPFGKRSKLAIDVFNKCSLYSNIIAFILPVSFMKFGVQKELNKDFKLVSFDFLPQNSFKDRDNDFDVNCVFQVWVRENSKFDIGIDLRIKEPPSIKHKDFDIWQYNATEEAFDCVYEDWEIATYRQGYKDYNKLFYQKDKDEIISLMSGKDNGKKVQFFFIKPKTEEARNIILKMDFNNLAARNTSTPGFGKADFVSYYQELLEK